MEGIVVTVSTQTLPYLEGLKENGAVILRCNGSFAFPDLNRMREVDLPILYDIPGDRSMFGKKRTSPMSDDEILQLAVKEKIDYVGVSYATCGADIRRVRDRIKELDPNSSVKIIGKLETAGACVNTDEIINASDICLIDRGDLGSAIGPENVPAMQTYLIRRCIALNTKVICATEMMMSTLQSEKPSCADVTDCYHAVMDGATYVMCSEETAIGKNPLTPVKVIQKIVRKVVADQSRTLVDRFGKAFEKADLEKEAEDLPKININHHQAIDCLNFANGTFSPLTGFLCSVDTVSVASSMRLTSGSVWPVPVLLQVSGEEHAAQVKQLKSAGATTGAVESKSRETQSAALGGGGSAAEEQKNKIVSESTSGGNAVVRTGLWEDGKLIAIMDVDDAFSINLSELSQSTFGTQDESHPGVKFLQSGGPLCLGGNITLIHRPEVGIPEKYALAPQDVREAFKSKGWKTIVGFQTRNLGHRAHEHLQKVGLEMTDGLLIHPLLGWKKKGDMLPDIILEGYEILIDKYYNRDHVMLSGLVCTMRYAGPKEAVFHAIMRRNFGCTHFIVGRDHAGVGSFYEKYAAHKIFDHFTKEELGIEILRLNGPYHCNISDGICNNKTGPQPEGQDNILAISGTEVRRMIAAGEHPSTRFMRPEIAEFLVAKFKEGKVFVE